MDYNIHAEFLQWLTQFKSVKEHALTVKPRGYPALSTALKPECEFTCVIYDNYDTVLSAVLKFEGLLDYRLETNGTGLVDCYLRALPRFTHAT